MSSTERRLVFVQYAGDYREAFHRLAQQGTETYYAQKYSVDAVSDLAAQMQSTTVICCMTDAPYDEMLSNGVRAIGAGYSGGRIPYDQLIQQVAALKPTHLVLRFPAPPLLRWAVRQNVDILVTLADSFSGRGWRDRIKNYRLARLLNHARVAWVGNHSMNASLSLQSIGVNPNKIIPWDWPSVVEPSAFTPKQLSPQSSYQMLYVGSVIAAKGVGDVLDAVQHLRSRQIDITLKVAGKGEIAEFQQRASELGIADAVEFLGIVPQMQIVPLMRSADVVVIPSRHEYPEGLPMTIYESLCARTPIIASDHPMFRDKLQDRVSAMVFPAANAVALADATQALLSDAALYHRLSVQSAETWQQIQIPVKWGELVQRWLANQPSDRQWLATYRLTGSFYTDRLTAQPIPAEVPAAWAPPVDAIAPVVEAPSAWAPAIDAIAPEEPISVVATGSDEAAR